ncbi:hypothetical protein JCM19239_7501 [Vibrio variabilis]|nr:hypothetical protein JCM19239_7501 [Vibrio variabilis]
MDNFMGSRIWIVFALVCSVMSGMANANTTFTSPILVEADKLVEIEPRKP